MCIAILNKVGTLPKEYIQNSWDNNYHGAGFAYSDGAKIVVHKQDKDVDSFYKKYAKARKKFPNASFLIHFRISTHGTISLDNLHPFVVGDVAVIHNGMVDLEGHSTTDKRSDTRYLCEEILANLPYGWQHSTGVHRFMENIAGWSKFVFLDVDNNDYIINEDEGHWFEGNWYSNNSYKQVNRYVDYGGKKVERTSMGYNSYGSSADADWDDYNSYNKSYSSTKPTTTTPKTSSTVSVPVTTIKLIEDYIQKNKIVDRFNSCFSAYVDKDLSDQAAVIDEWFYDGIMELNTWYHLGDDKTDKTERYELCVIEYNDKMYTLIGRPNSTTQNYVYVFPFAIRHDSLVTGLLTEFAVNKMYETASQKFERVMDDNYVLIQEAMGVMYDYHMDDEAVYGTCDSCMEQVNIKELSPIEIAPEYYACKSCKKESFEPAPF
jgi:glutamine amidotransferase